MRASKADDDAGALVWTDHHDGNGDPLERQRPATKGRYHLSRPERRQGQSHCAGHHKAGKDR